MAVLETDNQLRFSVKLGSEMPAYATGTGRAMLAYLTKRELDPLLKRYAFARVTAKTIASRRALLAALAVVRERAVSTVDSGTVAGVMSVAAPIFGMDGRVRAAVSSGGPAARLAQRLTAVERAVRDCAEEISGTLGYRGEWPNAAASAD